MSLLDGRTAFAVSVSCQVRSMAPRSDARSVPIVPPDGACIVPPDGACRVVAPVQLPVPPTPLEVCCALARHRRSRLHRRQLRPPDGTRAPRRPGDRARRTHLCRGPGIARPGSRADHLRAVSYTHLTLPTNREV